MEILEFKRSRIEIIVKFCGIASGFPNQAEAGFVGRFRANADDSGGIVRDGAVVERQTSVANECIAPMIGGVPYRIREDRREGVDPPKLIVGSLHEDGEKHFPDQ